MDFQTPLKTNLQQAYIDYLLSGVFDRCARADVAISQATEPVLKTYIEQGIGQMFENDLTMEVRHLTEIKLSILIDRMIEKAKDESRYSPEISVKIFNDIKSIFCPGFFPFC
ncbi:hypothetical protein [Taibaiella soli]|uniref:Uncharacterized protein n=1 Tax=Taibaiella soli TaxID=1649169 RepID=A0A2W2AJL1_9BACT|nr:hypothetical protein [Taibaiella soli]PZF73712.1 hypothetical protein DN068_06870 [Taibaiella soli]